MQEADAVDIAGKRAERAGEQQVAAGLQHGATVGDFLNFEKRVAQSAAACAGSGLPASSLMSAIARAMVSR